MSITKLTKPIPTNKKNDIKKYKATMIGGTVGAITGMIDGYYTDCANKKVVKKALDTYNSFDTEAKRKTIKTLHDKGIMLKEYKQYANNMLAKSPTPKIIKNALIYSVLFALAGLTIDKYHNKNKK